MGILLCGLGFSLALFCAWRSTVMGLSAVMLIGYLYGILRANFLDTYTHFLFDSAVLGFYISYFSAHWPRARNPAEARVLSWVAVLFGWVALMFLVPLQHPLIQLVGLRGNAFLVPFLLIGSRLDDREGCDLSVWLAALNLMALGFGIAEFFLGVPAFFPHNSVTELIYRSNDVAGNTALRIPACFGAAHGFAGTLVFTLPWLFGVWIQPQITGWRHWLLMAGIAAAMVGTFMAGVRLFIPQLLLMLIVVIFSGKMSPGLWFCWAVILGGVGYIVSGEERLQRFMTLRNTDMVVERIEGSVNMGFLELITTYPMGNGLGGGGTSIPYFLQHLIEDPVLVENEYGRILLEQGIVGLGAWVSFIAWLLTRPGPGAQHPWALGCRLIWYSSLVSFIVGLIGTGLMTSIPQTPILFLSMGFYIGSRSPLVQRTGPPQAKAGPISLRQAHLSAIHG